jgi:hypothetical protein
VVGPAHARGEGRAHLLRQSILNISDLVKLMPMLVVNPLVVGVNGLLRSA